MTVQTFSCASGSCTAAVMLSDIEPMQEMAYKALGGRGQSCVSSLKQLDLAVGKPVVERNSQKGRSLSARRSLWQDGYAQVGAYKGQRSGHEIRFIANVQEQPFAMCNSLDCLSHAAFPPWQDQSMGGCLAKRDGLLMGDGVTQGSKHNQAILKQRSCA